jgi:hypothetical protein
MESWICDLSERAGGASASPVSRVTHHGSRFTCLSVARHAQHNIRFVPFKRHPFRLNFYDPSAFNGIAFV